MATRARRRSGQPTVRSGALSRAVARPPSLRALLQGVDHGSPIVVPPYPYVRRELPEAGRKTPDEDWGGYLDSFLAHNKSAFESLNLEPRIVAGRDRIRLELQAGGRAGAVPLISPITGKVAGGVVIAPRFGWPGVGRVLSATGWGSGPEFLSFPLVPGSGREVPPWVLAGPVLMRIAEMLGGLRVGYLEKQEVRSQPRGRIEWGEYTRRQLASGQWHRLPCRFSELGSDRRLRQAIRWTLERVYGELRSVGNDSTAASLSSLALQLLEQVADVVALRPRAADLQRSLSGAVMASRALTEGLRAMGWIADERGLGGGRTSDGLSWSLPLELLWERYVESVYRTEAVHRGAMVRSGGSGETTIPLGWRRGDIKSLTHLVPDLVITAHNEVQIVDAKYKPHFQELTVSGWHHFTESASEAHRADVHQVLAYAASLPAQVDVRATLVYPVTSELSEELGRRGIGTSVADIPRGTGKLRLELRAMAFGRGASRVGEAA